MTTRPGLPSARPSFLHSDRALARAAQPIVRFLHVEAAGAVLLVVATVVALVWANSPWKAGYEQLWSTVVSLDVGSYSFEEDLGHLVNDLLMAFFFLVVGMEIKRELVVGELRDRRTVALPVLAAVGGMLVPAAIYTALNAGADGAGGWGIPMATDIAFALGVIALLGRRVDPSLKLLLLTLAIVDDIGAIGVIALFYSSDLRPALVLVAAAIALVIAAMHHLHVTYPVVFVVLGFALWLAVYESGVHATIAGVVFGLLTPARPTQTELDAEEIVDLLENRGDLTAADVRVTAAAIKGSVSMCERAIDVMHPWTSYLIVPVFALANAGVELSMDSITSPSRVFVGVVLGLVVGKLVGVTAFGWLTVRLGWGRLAPGVRWTHFGGTAALAGIGFTVSLFISGLALDAPDLQQDAKVGILVASAVAAVLGVTVFVSSTRGNRARRT